MQAQIIPASNRIDWASVAGIEGGIPRRATIFTNLANIDATGALSVLSQIQLAINLCPSNQVVKLPPGRFRLGGELTLKDHVTLRGSGPQTVLIPASKIWIGGGGGRVSVNVTGGTQRGSTSVTLASPPTGLTVGSTIMLNERNNTNFVHPYGYEQNETAPLLCSYCDEPSGGTRVRSQMMRVTSIAGNVVNFTPALYSDFSQSLAPQIFYPQAMGPLNMRAYVGIEDLTLTNNSDNLIRFENAQNCWVSNVTFHVGADAYMGVIGYYAHRIAIQHCTFTGYTPHAQAILTQIGTEGWLVENNLFNRFNIMFLNVGRQGGHVFAYNFLSANTNAGTALINDHGNHGAHPQFLLYEGNKLVKHHADSIHGSSSHYTLFRNWFRGRRPETTFGAGCIWMDSWNYYYQTVGNVLGYPGMTDWIYEYQSDGSKDNDTLPNSLIMYRYGLSGYNQWDVHPRSKSTTLRHGNYDFGRNVVEWNPNISERTIPSSMYLTSKPAWFGNLPWPAIGPDIPGYYTNMIPAEYRFRNNGADPPSGPQNNAPLVVADGNPKSGIPPLAVSFSSAGSSDPEGSVLTYNWSFGDGGTSTAANPSHTYQSEGTFVARLSVSDGTNTSVSPDITIVVGNQPPIVVANGTPSAGAPPLAVSFSSSGSRDPEGAPLAFSWQFGDGGTSTAANPSHTYQAAGVYNARLTVSDGVKTSTSSDITIRVGTGLVASYSFDAGSGATAVDDSGNGNTAAIAGATWANGRVGSGLSFNGSSAVVNVPDSASLDVTDGVTVEAWVFPTALSGDYQSIITKPMDAAFSAVSYVLHGGSRSSGLPSFATSGTQNNLVGTAALPLNTWSHLAGTFDGATLRLYVNGVQVATRAQSGAITPSAEGLRIGLSWAGVIDEVRIYNRALSLSEVQRDMTTPVGVSRPATPQGFGFAVDQ